MALFLQPPPPPPAPLSYSPPSTKEASQFKKLVEQPLEKALNNLAAHFHDLEKTPNESARYYYITRILEMLSDESFRPTWPIFYPSSHFEDSIIKVLHDIQTEIKEIPRTTPPTEPTPPAPVIDITPMVAVMDEKIEDLKRETASSLKSFADAVKASAPVLPSPLQPPPKLKISTPSKKGNLLPKAVIRTLGHVAIHARPSFVDITSKIKDSLHDCQGHSGPSLITTPNERLCTVRLSQRPGN